MTDAPAAREEQAAGACRPPTGQPENHLVVLLEGPLRRPLFPVALFAPALGAFVLLLLIDVVDARLLVSRVR